MTDQLPDEKPEHDAPAEDWWIEEERGIDRSARPAPPAGPASPAGSPRPDVGYAEGDTVILGKDDSDGSTVPEPQR